MKKRLLSCIMAAALALSLAPAALAAPPAEEMIQVLGALDIMGGYPDGDLRLSQSVTRAEFTKMAVAASPMGENVGDTTTVSPYPDVPSTHWAASYVEAAVAAGLVNGFLDGTFHPSEHITLAQGVTIAVRLLGYKDLDFSGTWPSGQMALYRSLDLDEGITADASTAMSRRDAMCLFYNLLTADTKDGRPYLMVLGKPMTPTGDIDRVALINDAMDGPLVLAPGWEDTAEFRLSDMTTFYRGGKPSSAAALQTNDVLYYSRSMRTVWAYSNKVSGQLQAVSPSAASPSSVTVAGRTYPIETADAAYALSNLGGHSIGDSVTLLLGRGGGVAAVADPKHATGMILGVVTAITESQYTDPNGNPYSAKSLVITATDGNSYTYPSTNTSWEIGDLAQINMAGSKAELTHLSRRSTSGRFNSDGSALGNVPLSDAVEILDTNDNGAAIRIYPRRMAGVVLEDRDVHYYQQNASGEIDVLILNDVTGDLYSYGILTDKSETDMGSFINSSYQYDIGGRPYFYLLQNGIWNVENGPVSIEGNPSAPTSMHSLEQVDLTSADAFTAVTKNQEFFPVSPALAVYEFTNDSYRLSSLERVRSGYRLVGCYDKEARNGGAIRVILATPAG